MLYLIILNYIVNRLILAIIKYWRLTYLSIQLDVSTENRLVMYKPNKLLIFLI